MNSNIIPKKRHKDILTFSQKKYEQKLLYKDK